MKRAFILCALVSLSACATDNWSRTDTIGEITVAATLAADAYQTAQFRNHPTQEEAGWVRGICGLRPSSACSYEYFGTVAATHFLIARILPASWRPYWQGSVAAVETVDIVHNMSLKP